MTPQSEYLIFPHEKRKQPNRRAYRMKAMHAGPMPDPITDHTMAVIIGHMRAPTTDPMDPTAGDGPITTVPTIDHMQDGIRRFPPSLSQDSPFISVSSRHMKSQRKKDGGHS